MLKAVKMVCFFVSLLFSLTATLPDASAQKLINGAGATFPYPLYSKWFFEYEKIDSSNKFNYQSIGSGGGIRQIISRTVDFGATDGPMTDEQLKSAPGEIFHIPTVMGAVVVTYNLPDVKGRIKLTADVLADIFLGKIKKWNDKKLISINQDLSLPNKDIVVVHRSDGSGTTFIFVDYLSNTNPEWASKVGKSTSVNWPAGIGAKGNEGVTGQIKNTPGAIGYVELAYAMKNNLPYASIKNKAGKFIEPTLESITHAAEGTARSMPDDFRISIVNPPGEKAYPIGGLTWLLVYKNQTDPEKGKALVKFLWWALHDGQKFAQSLLYAPLPERVVKMVEKKIKEINSQGKPLL